MPSAVLHNEIQLDHDMLVFHNLNHFDVNEINEMSDECWIKYDADMKNIYGVDWEEQEDNAYIKNQCVEDLNTFFQNLYWRIEDFTEYWDDN